MGELITALALAEDTGGRLSHIVMGREGRRMRADDSRAVCSRLRLGGICNDNGEKSPGVGFDACRICINSL